MAESFAGGYSFDFELDRNSKFVGVCLVFGVYWPGSCAGCFYILSTCLGLCNCMFKLMFYLAFYRELRLAVECFRKTLR